jgi:3-oxoacyl-[acyl-carrier-protein] synthase-1
MNGFKDSSLSHLKPVPVTAFTTINGCGLGDSALSQAMLSSRSGLGELTVLDIPFATPVGEIKEELPAIRSELVAYDSRNARVALAALNFAEDGVRAAIEVAKSTYGGDRIGVIIGTSTSGLSETELAYQVLLAEGHMPDDFHFLTRHAYQSTPRFLQKELQLNGPCFAVSTACSSGAKAIAAGQRLINYDVCDAVLVGGVDTLCRLTLRGFNSLELVSSDFCHPMDKNRNGINIGEGAGLLLLQKPDAQYRHLPHVLSVGESSDAYHMSSPHPEGKGAVAAMSNALNLAGLKSGDVDYINLHATATPINDQVEAKAVYEVFKDSVPCSGSKGVTGHTLGAAGAIEAIVALLALRDQMIPGTCGLQEIDKDFHCHVVKDSLTNQSLQTVMSNSFGFGGNNSSMIFSKDYE